MEHTRLNRGHITSPAGFKAGVAGCGLKQSGNLDLALLVSETPATAAATFTLNKVKAAPLIVTRENLKSDCARAVIVNSGIANACTGQQGLMEARQTCSIVARALSVKAEEVLVASTGIIGHRLPMEKMEAGIAKAAASLSPRGGVSAARAIMTTDTVPKHAAVRFSLNGKTVTIGGMAKGAGMIAPNMATLLCFLTTDAAIEKVCLKRMLLHAVERSFNSITVDGDTSTNDMALILANGAAGNPPIAQPHAVFQSALEILTLRLAKQIVQDGEGATKLIEIEVVGAASEEEAHRIGMTVANSSLVKTAVFGGDPNWGRIAAAAGRAPARLAVDKLSLWLGSVKVFENGQPRPFSLKRAERAVGGKTVRIRLDAGLGEGRWTVWTCDFSYDYVKINAEYHT